MILSDIIEQIVEDTGRYDQETIIANTTRTGILQLHAKARFKKDIMEETIVVPTPANLIRMTMPPRARDIISLAIVNNLGQPIYGLCERTSASILLDEYNRVPTKPYFYVSGNTVTVSSGNYKTDVAYVYFNYIQSPDISALGCETWLMSLYPELVMNYVMYKIHSKNGNESKARFVGGLYQDQLSDLLNDQDSV